MRLMCVIARLPGLRRWSRLTLAPVTIALAGLLPGHDVAAQQVSERQWVRSVPVRRLDAVAAPDTIRRPNSWHRFGTRAGLAGLGAVGGALVGVGLGALVCVPATCEGSAELAVTSGFGAVVGSSALAALPRLESRCSYTRRLILAAVGSASGAALGAVAAPDDAWVIIPLATISGASVATLGC